MRNIFVNALFGCLFTLLSVSSNADTASTIENSTEQSNTDNVIAAEKNSSNLISLASQESLSALLTAIKTLSQSSPISLEKVKFIFGWVSASQFRSISTGAVVTDLYAGDKRTWGYPAFSITAAKPLTRLSFQLDENLLCIPAQAVLQEFGRKFKSSIVLIHPYPKQSPEMTENFRLFGHGPTYTFYKENRQIEVSFSFPATLCLSNVTVTETLKD